ncbi:hypothetical protein [Thiolinea disciformis]|uniref:hypothetical protein n=1 Tax=Thiolinea disciformis TaxID=125614 RepID=UPI00036E8F8D|nr:hypothetical protein [Thiolinea disciformis]
MNLHRGIDQAYTLSTTATSVVGFGDLNQNKGVHTPQSLVVFFRPQESLLVVCVGNYPQGLVAELPLYSVRQPDARCHHLLARMMSAFENQTKDIIMASTVFMVREGISPEERARESQQLFLEYSALFQLIVELLSDHDYLSSRSGYLEFCAYVYGFQRLMALDALLRGGV